MKILIIITMLVLSTTAYSKIISMKSIGGLTITNANQQHTALGDSNSWFESDDTKLMVSATTGCYLYLKYSYAEFTRITSSKSCSQVANVLNK